ncbi:efflux RND transporter periplasmic adaptor subunit [Agriterribacter sp.]|uniref:efflux RND transporter periplasmic adaptor subunit n=1 Tax=Agriterribacter sp. TaxID=2821509 RepID=UPI002BA42ABE|nr:efflux RND transporter periplasmic adaptor subunit [Agriterribacter sp.]HTN09259.1 efflux RND transporter periplasmic adaptor subunit [Agriterribacter sp.]
MKRKQNSTLLLLGLITLFAGACSSSSEKDVVKEKTPAIEVSVENPLINTDNSIAVTGQIESSHSANISTRVMGYITGIKVKAGDHVHKGQLLVTISNEDILAKRAQADAMISGAEASFKSAEKDYARFTSLYHQKSATAKELDNVTLQYQAAKAGLQSARQMKAEANAILAYTNITAPFSGVVAQKLMDAGSMANPGMPILVVEENKNLLVSAVIPETEISRIQLKSPATIFIKSIDKTFNGTVTEISPSSIATGGQYVVKINLPQEAQNSLNAGMYTNVNIITKDKSPAINSEAVLVPLSAINHIGQLTALYTVSNNNTALLRYVRLGKTYGNNVEILSGLNKNESFIASAEGKLYNGVPVKVKPI